MLDWPIWPLLHGALALVSGMHILLCKSDSRAALAWLAFVFLFPLGGPILYWLFGVNRVRRKAQGARLFRWDDRGFLPSPRDDAAAPADPLEMVGWRVTAVHPQPDNRVDVLAGGEAAYPAMLEAIENARHEILLSTFIFAPDGIGKQFVAALAAARERGVDVRLLVDDVGRRYQLPTIARALRRAGVPVAWFMPLRLLPPSLSLNLRNHRKLLIVDGQRAFAGGMNISDSHVAAGLARVSDVHFEFAGPIVDPLRQLFARDWQRTTGAGLAGLVVEPAPAQEAGAACRLVFDGPDEKLDHLALLIEGAISAARRRVVIVTPYFLPERRLVGVLQAAALRGVKVSVVLPGENNWPVVNWALKHHLWSLVRLDVDVYFRPPPFAHEKFLLIDEAYALVGSTNLDPRSLRLNFELGIEVFDAAVTARLAAHADEAIATAARFGRQEVNGRRLPERIRDALAALIAPYL